MPATPAVRIGTSSWSTADWRGPFYPEGMKSIDFLEFYAQRFDTVECDATFYHIPKPETVDGWYRRTPPGFLMSSKLPRAITHDAGLVDCDDLVAGFLHAMDGLGEKRGPIVAQFGYFAKGRDPEEYATGDDFRRRLAAFLDRWPSEVDLAVEVRNGGWLAPPLLDLLRERSVSLVCSVYYTLPGPDRWMRIDWRTGPWAYARFLGNHRRMDRTVADLKARGERASDWGALAVDREDELRRWVRPIADAARKGAQPVAYFNNHYAGFGPGSATIFARLWDEFVGVD